MEMLMKKEPVDEHAAREVPPTETERNFGVLAAGLVALAAVGTAIYWMS